MSKIRASKTMAAAKQKVKREWPTVVYLWIIGLGFLSYLIARFALGTYPHPYHWGSGIAGAVLGVGVGWIWYRWRGDVF